MNGERLFAERGSYRAAAGEATDFGMKDITRPFPRVIRGEEYHCPVFVSIAERRALVTFPNLELLLLKKAKKGRLHCEGKVKIEFSQ